MQNHNPVRFLEDEIDVRLIEQATRQYIDTVKVLSDSAQQNFELVWLRDKGKYRLTLPDRGQSEIVRLFVEGVIHIILFERFSVNDHSDLASFIQRTSDRLVLDNQGDLLSFLATHLTVGSLEALALV